MQRLNRFRAVFAIAAMLGLMGSMAAAQNTQGRDCILTALYPPFMIGTTPDNAGISIDIMREAAKRAGREIEIEFMPFQRILYELNASAKCIMPALFRNESREAQFRWIETYHNAELRFMTIDTPLKGLEDGRRMTSIAVETDASADQFLSGQNFDNLVRISSPASSAQMLQAGRIDAWAQSAWAASRLWQEMDLHPPLQFSEPIYTVPIYVAAGVGYPDVLADIYQQAIQSIVADGTAARIISKYEPSN